MLLSEEKYCSINIPPGNLVNEYVYIAKQVLYLDKLPARYVDYIAIWVFIIETWFIKA